MSSREEKQNFGSLLDDTSQNDDLPPEQLSGDQNAEKSVLMSDVGTTKANFFLSVMTIMKTVIGAGILSLPLTVSKLGYALSMGIFFIIITIIQFTSTLLLKAKNLSKHSNYNSIIYHIFRTKFVLILGSFMILFKNIGICIAEILILKSSIRKIFETYVNQQDLDIFFFSTYFVVIICAILQFPLTLVSKIQKLKFFAFIGVTGITVFVFLFTITFFVLIGDQKRNWRCHQKMVAVGDDLLSMVVVIPNLMLALTYSANFFPIFKGMKNVNDQKMTKASLVGLCTCLVFYLIVGQMGYCLFGNTLQANFLLSFDSSELNDVTYLILNLTFLTSVFFSFPVLFFGARNNLIAIMNTIISIIKKHKRVQKTDQEDTIQNISSYIETQDKLQRKRKAKILFYVYTVCLFTLIILTGAFATSIQSVFNVVGSIASNSISFIFPSLFYIALVHKKSKTKTFRFYISFGLFCFFVPFGIFSVISKFLK